MALNRVYCFITGDRYKWLIEPYIHFHDKYWGDPLTIVTDLDIKTHSKHTIIPMPSYCKHFYKDNMGKMIKETINKFPEPLAVISLPDFWPCRHVEIDRMRVLEEYIVKNGSIARAHLWRGRGAEGVQNQSSDIVAVLNDGTAVNRISPHCRTYGQLGATSGLLAIWDKKFLNMAYPDSWTWADWELKGRDIMATNWDVDGKTMKVNGGKWGKWYSVTTNPTLVDIQHVCYTHKSDLADLYDLLPDDKTFARPFVPKNYEIYE